MLVERKYNKDLIISKFGLEILFLKLCMYVFFILQNKIIFYRNSESKYRMKINHEFITHF